LSNFILQKETSVPGVLFQLKSINIFENDFLIFELGNIG